MNEIFLPDKIYESIQLEKKYIEQYKMGFVPPDLRRLARAVFQNALQDLTGRDERYRQAATTWFFGDDDYFLSFCSACAFIGLDPVKVRTGLREYLKCAEKPKE